MTKKTLILGGGLSGLLAAWHLRAAGRAVEVWEASDAVGGWAQTMSWPGPQGEPGWLERGPQGLRFAREGALASLIQELQLPLQPVLPSSHRWLGRQGRRFPSPTTLPGLFRAPGLSLGARLRFLMEPLVATGKDPNEHLQAFMARRFGVAFAREWLPAVVAGVFAAPPAQIGLDALPGLKRLDKRGGLLLGGLRAGPERTRHPVGGTGGLAQRMAEQLGCAQLNRRAEALEPLANGGWRVHGEALSVDVDEVTFALPPKACATLLGPLAPRVKGLFETIPMLDLRVWHSRHAPIPGWERGFNLLIHPPEGNGLLGIVGLPAEDPRTVPGLLQVRSYLGGAYAVDPVMNTWPGVAAELHRWLPELSEAIQVREEACPGAFPLLEPGHAARVAALLASLPRGLHWIGAARFGPGIADLAEGIQIWAQVPRS